MRRGSRNGRRIEDAIIQITRGWERDARTKITEREEEKSEEDEDEEEDEETEQEWKRNGRCNNTNYWKVREKCKD